MSRILEVNRCPNCSGRLEKSEDGLKLICPFCSSEFELAEPEESSKEEVKEPVKENKKEKEEKPKEEQKAGGESTSDWGNDDWFEARIPAKKLSRGTNSKKVIKAFVYCAGTLKTPEKILKYIKTDLEKGSGIGMPGENEAKLNAFVNRVKGNLDADEKPLIYANTALLSNGKKGILVTDKRTVIGRSSVSNVLHEDLDSISFDVGDDIPFIYLNSNDKNQMESIMTADYDMMGALAALACAFAFEQNPGRDKIVITKQKDDD